MHIPAFYERLPILLILGLTILFAYYIGKNMRFIKLPSIIGFMVFGVIIGPSLFNIFTEELQEQLYFITDISLGFVALSIGMELKFSTLKRLGKSIIYIIILESLAAFTIVLLALYLLTGNLPLAIIFAAIAPASAPAGTVAVIREYRAKGSLTKALFAVVGFDDGLGIIIFGFASAIVQNILSNENGNLQIGFLPSLLKPLLEIGSSILIGLLIGYLFSVLAQRLKNKDDLIILIFGFILVICGIAHLLHISIILTVMVVGVYIINTQTGAIINKINDNLRIMMPLLFILFFTLAGSNLHLSALPSLGILGIVYVVARSSGLILGSRLGAIIGKAEKNIKNYLGLGILSQAGVAIGLSLLVKQDFNGIGKIIDHITGTTTGDQIGSIVITTITATCIFFEIIGPVLTRLALIKAGEIKLQD